MYIDRLTSSQISVPWKLPIGTSKLILICFFDYGSSSWNSTDIQQCLINCFSYSVISVRPAAKLKELSKLLLRCYDKN